MFNDFPSQWIIQNGMTHKCKRGYQEDKVIENFH